MNAVNGRFALLQYSETQIVCVCVTEKRDTAKLHLYVFLAAAFSYSCEKITATNYMLPSATVTET